MQLYGSTTLTLAICTAISSFLEFIFHPNNSPVNFAETVEVGNWGKPPFGNRSSSLIYNKTVIFNAKSLENFQICVIKIQNFKFHFILHHVFFFFFQEKFNVVSKIIYKLIRYWFQSVRYFLHSNSLLGLQDHFYAFQHDPDSGNECLSHLYYLLLAQWLYGIWYE